MVCADPAIIEWKSNGILSCILKPGDKVKFNESAFSNWFQIDS